MYRWTASFCHDCFDFIVKRLQLCSGYFMPHVIAESSTDLIKELTSVVRSFSSFCIIHDLINFGL